jgi:hypothetical protein
MRPSQRIALEQERAALLEKGQRFLDDMEAAERARKQVPPVSNEAAGSLETVPPQVGSSKAPDLPSEPELSKAWESSANAPADRGICPGGKNRIVAPWFAALAKACADGTKLRVAAARLGLSFSKRDVLRLYQLREFNRLRRAYRRLYLSEFWGKPNSERVLEKLLLLENRAARSPRPRSAKYISHVLK